MADPAAAGRARRQAHLLRIEERRDRVTPLDLVLSDGEHTILGEELGEIRRPATVGKARIASKGVLDRYPCRHLPGLHGPETTDPRRLPASDDGHPRSWRPER